MLEKKKVNTPQKGLATYILRYICLNTNLLDDD